MMLRASISNKTLSMIFKCIWPCLARCVTVYHVEVSAWRMTLSVYNYSSYLRIPKTSTSVCFKIFYLLLLLLFCFGLKVNKYLQQRWINTVPCATHPDFLCLQWAGSRGFFTENLENSFCWFCVSLPLLQL